MRTFALALLFIGMASLAQAQTSIVVAVFADTAVDANAATPVGQPVGYVATCGLTPKAVETTPIINPSHAYIDDLADATRDCGMDISAQITALQPGRSYRLAVREVSSGEPYGPLSTVFLKQGRKVRLR